MTVGGGMVGGGRVGGSRVGDGVTVGVGVSVMVGVAVGWMVVYVIASLGRQFAEGWSDE